MQSEKTGDANTRGSVGYVGSTSHRAGYGGAADGDVPHKTDITVGSLRFSLAIDATFDANGDYAGNIWSGLRSLSVTNWSLVSLEYRNQVAASVKLKPLSSFR